MDNPIAVTQSIKLPTLNVPTRVAPIVYRCWAKNVQEGVLQLWAWFSNDQTKILTFRVQTAACNLAAAAVDISLQYCSAVTSSNSTIVERWQDEKLSSSRKTTNIPTVYVNK